MIIEIVYVCLSLFSKAKELGDRLQEEQAKNMELKRQLDRSYSQSTLTGMQSINRRRLI